MENANPYASPKSEITQPAPWGVDTDGTVDPKSRLTRLSFLAWCMVVGVAYVALLFYLVETGVVDFSKLGSVTDPFAYYKSIPLLILSIALTAVIVMFAIRRLHDYGSSGWWMVLYLVPIANFVLFLTLLFKRGDEGANRFGPPRPTSGWEKVVGIIGAAFFGLSLVLLIIGAGFAFIEGFNEGYLHSQQPPMQ